MSKNLEQLYQIGMLLFKHKQELMKDPDLFKDALEYLKKAKDDYEDEQPQEDDMEGMSIVDDPNADIEDDDAAKWLKDAESKKPAAEEKQPASRMSDWKPREDYSPKEKAEIEQHMANGYSHREAERLAGAHKGPSDLNTALRSGVKHSMPSDRMIKDLKSLTGEWLDQADRREKMSASPDVNPMKHASGKMIEAHEKHMGDYNKAHTEFLNSDKVKGLKGRDRHNAIQEWKAQYKKDNPQMQEGLEEVSGAQKTYDTARDAAKQLREEKMKHIATGGVGMPTDMSAQEALQHIGGGKNEEGGYTGTITSDPAALFAQRNPKLLSRLNADQKDRLKRVDSAASAQGVVRVRKKGTT